MFAFASGIQICQEFNWNAWIWSATEAPITASWMMTQRAILARVLGSTDRAPGRSANSPVFPGYPIQAGLTHILRKSTSEATIPAILGIDRFAHLFWGLAYLFYHFWLLKDDLLYNKTNKSKTFKIWRPSSYFHFLRISTSRDSSKVFVVHTFRRSKNMIQI